MVVVVVVVAKLTKAIQWIIQTMQVSTQWQLTVKLNKFSQMKTVQTTQICKELETTLECI